MNDWREFEGLSRRLACISVIDNIKDPYWNIRPSPHFDTVEIRIMDTPLALGHAVNMVGFIQATVHWLLTKRPFKYQERDYLLYKFNCFQACCLGMAGTVTGVNTDDDCHLSGDTSRLPGNIATSTDKVGVTSMVEAIHLQVKNGHDKTQNMYDFVAEGGSLSDLVKKHCEIWAGL